MQTPYNTPNSELASHHEKQTYRYRSDTPSFLTDRQVAQLLNVSLALVRKWRQRSAGPKPQKIGGRLVRYELGDVLAFARREAE